MSRPQILLPTLIGGADRNTPAPPPALPRASAAGPNHYQRAWACWAAAVLTSFAAIEVAALRAAPGHGTLSAQLRRKRAISAAAIAAFGIWATVHIAWQGEQS